MSDQFTTTFVPKKPMMPAVSASGNAVSRPVGLLTSLSTLFFFITLALAAGVYFWGQFQAKKNIQLEESLTRVEKTFEPQLITQLQKLDKQLKNGNLILNNHTVVSPVFAVLESSVIPQVRFTRFDFGIDEATKTASVKMSGEADGYAFIAQQSEILSKNTSIRNMIFSNFVLTQRGKISFDVSFTVLPEFIDFKRAPLFTTSSAPVVQ